MKYLICLPQVRLLINYLVYLPQITDELPGISTVDQVIDELPGISAVDSSVMLMNFVTEYCKLTLNYGGAICM